MNTKGFTNYDICQVSEEDIEEMFDYADSNKDGKLSYQVYTHNILAALFPSILRFENLLECLLFDKELKFRKVRL